jgi:hypothetical protein
MACNRDIFTFNTQEIPASFLINNTSVLGATLKTPLKETMPTNMQQA